MSVVNIVTVFIRIVHFGNKDNLREGSLDTRNNPSPEFARYHFGHVATETVDTFSGPVAQYVFHFLPGVRYRVKMSSGVMQVVHSIIQLDGFIPVVPVGPCVKAVVSGSLGRHFLVIPLFRIIKVDFACQLLSRYIVEIVLWIEILRVVIVLTQILYTSRFGQRVILPCHMVRNEIHDDLQSAFMAACNQMLEFLHTLVYMLGQVRVDVIIIADGIRRACFPFHNGRVVLGNAVCSVIRLRSVRYQSGVPDVCSA